MKTQSIARLALATAIAVATLATAGAQGPRDRNPQQGRPGQGQQNQGGGFHFRDQDRQQFQQRYHGDVSRWQKQPNRRPNPGFRPGQRVPRGYKFQAVPSSYYRGLQPPPPGYRYGYYNGYVVAYNPTTQIIADVLDLITR
jgi:Ni/Co efflux regulator RcnB